MGSIANDWLGDEKKQMLSEKMKKVVNIGSPIRRAFEEGKRLEQIYGAENVFDLSIGNPEAPAPDAVKDSIQRLLQSPSQHLHAYMCDAGYEEVREKIANHLNRKHGTQFSIDNVLMSVGAAGAMNVAMYCLLNPDDEVMVMKPYYPGYTNFIWNWDAKMVEVEPNPQNFQPDFIDFEKKITPVTKMVLVNSPNNPTGTIYTEDTIQKLAEILDKKQKEYGHAIYLLSDEPYRDLNYTGEPLPFWTKYYDNTIVVYSFSKSLSVPGERIGYAIIPDALEESRELMKAMRVATGMLGFVNAPALFQRVVSECLEVEAPVDYYRKNRDALYQHLQKLGFSMVEPEGAFYIFVQAPNGDEQALLQAAHACNILLVGGAAFGYPGYARISFCVSFEKINRSLTAFEKMADLLGIGR